MTRCVRVLAPNPGPMTLDGTNTWVLAEPGAAQAVVVDPGPADDGHLRRVLDEVVRDGRRLGLVLLTHRHGDHSEGVPRLLELAAATDVPVRAADPAHVARAQPLRDGEELDVDLLGGLAVRVVAAPGHTSDSVAFVLPAERALLTGDTVLGRGTTVVAHPDGRLGDYLATLRRLRELSASEGLVRVLPGHGPVLDDPVGVLDAYLAHRAERLAQVEAALAAGARTPAQVVDVVYGDVGPGVRAAAEASVRAQLDHLRSLA